MLIGRRLIQIYKQKIYHTASFQIRNTAVSDKFLLQIVFLAIITARIKQSDSYISLKQMKYLSRSDYVFTGNVNNIDIIPYMLSHQVENQSIGLRTLFESICELDIFR